LEVTIDWYPIPNIKRNENHQQTLSFVYTTKLSLRFSFSLYILEVTPWVRNLIAGQLGQIDLIFAVL
jgi:hypothetical protein